MKINRRRALALAALGASPKAALAAPAQVPVAFGHGVASGDPLTDRVVLWTRVTPAPGTTSAVQVAWEVAAEPSFAAPVSRGAFVTDWRRDYTVKVDAGGLKPGQDYFYRFKAGAAVSPVGRTRTLPVGPVERAELAFVTCSLYPAGYFNAYHHIAQLDRVDAVVHLGDYIYEYGGADGDYGMEGGRRLGRMPEPAHEIITLSDYRTRHALYKRDLDLQAAHARAPWICVWDDHEVANDVWVGGAENHQPAAEGDWLNRESNALRAYYEWMPIREPEPGRAFEAINRSFDFGDLATLVMVESRLVARSSQLAYERPGDVPMTVYDSADPAVRKPVADPRLAAQALEAAAAGRAPPAPLTIGPDPAALAALLANPERQMLGARQEQWLGQELARSVKAGRPWRILGNQVVMARTKGPDVRKALGPERLEQVLAAMPPAKREIAAGLAALFTYDVPFDLDGWDGYPAARERVYAAIKASGGDAIVLSGDSHAFWANELHDSAGDLIAVEFGASAVTSPSPGEDVPGVDLGKIFVDQNPEVRFCDQLSKGYILLTLTPAAASAEFRAVETMTKPYAARVLTRFTVAPRGPSGPARLAAQSEGSVT
jgi:alkaline phosphatase D